MPRPRAHVRIVMVVTVLGIAAAVLAAGQAMGTSARSSKASPGIVFERDGDLFAIALDGSRTVRLTDTPAWDETWPAASPDGRWIVYTRGSALWLMSVDGRKKRRLTAGDDWSPTWSPDGRHVYFSRTVPTSPDGCGEIFRKRTDGKGPAERVTRSRGHSHYAPSVSPDGQRVAFTDADQCAGGTTNYAVSVVDRFGRPTRDLRHLPGNRHVDGEPFWEDPAWSPDGARIALVGGRATLYLANANGTGVRRITRNDEYRPPAWSPDGDWIAFVGNGDVSVIRPDGRGRRRLAATKQHEDTPSWLRRMPG